MKANRDGQGTVQGHLTIYHMRGLLVLPVLNGADQLKIAVPAVVSHCSQSSNVEFQILICDNGSTDSTPQVASQLMAAHENLRYLRLPRPGRGNALRISWSSFDVDIYAYMDIDLATNLEAWGRLITPLVNDAADITIGNRRHKNSFCTRTISRRFYSHVYHSFARALLSVNSPDLQCGFKALTRNAVALVNQTTETGWLFDTELIAIAERSALRIMDVPVTWSEGSTSTVGPISDAMRCALGLIRLKLNLSPPLLSNVNRH